MPKSVKRHRNACMTLLFLVTVAVLTGCENNVHTGNPESINSVDLEDGKDENNEDMKFFGTMKKEEDDACGTRKEKALNDARNLNSSEYLNSSENLNGSDNLDDSENLNASEQVDITEIYERFLDGELTVEWKGQQVYINELFWDNDIEYCFCDIDGDGSEELHIRDKAVYYAVKIQDETPEIIFEGWWSYEPVMTDKLCGILRYSQGYGSERMEFLEIGADGSEESGGSFYWSDHNKNGDIDEEDLFTGRGDTGMEQYIQYREEYIAARAENKLKWTDRRFKNFVTWQEAYIDFIKKLPVTVRWGNDMDDGMDYALIYVDADEIPELYIDTGGMATGEMIVSFYDGNIGIVNRDRVGIRYMEHGGLLYSASGAMGFYPCNIYRLENGTFSEIGTGWYSEHYDEQGNYFDEQGKIVYDYYWEGVAVTEAEYEACIHELIDISKCEEPSLLYSEDEMLEILMDKGEISYGADGKSGTYNVMFGAK